MSRSTFYRTGIVIRHRQLPLYVCRDSFKGDWYWGPARSSEIFGSVKSAINLKPLFPEGRPVDYGSYDIEGPDRVTRHSVDYFDEWRLA